jgi:hypothetical protein
MSARAMKLLLADLAREASKSLQRPTEPKSVMEAFHHGLSVRAGRLVQLAFRAFPPAIPVSGLHLDCGNRSIMVVEERAAAQAQLVIFDHELWHEEKGSCGHGSSQRSATARVLTTTQTPEILIRAAEQILAAEEVPWGVYLAVAARANSVDQHAMDTETIGLPFGREVRTWEKGRYARGPVDPTTVEGRIDLSLRNRSGQVLG